MLELLEKLDPKFNKAFKKKVSMEEVTALSLQLSDSSAVVLTNRHLYLLQKKFFWITCAKNNFNEIEKVYFKDEFVVVTTKGEKSLKVKRNKRGLARKIVKKVREKISGNIKPG